jgi:hypothetical protein
MERRYTSRRENRGGRLEKQGEKKTERVWGIPLHVNADVCGQGKNIYVLLYL